MVMLMSVMSEMATVWIRSAEFFHISFFYVMNKVISLKNEHVIFISASFQ